MRRILSFANHSVKYSFYGAMAPLNELRFHKNILCVSSEANIFETARSRFSNSYLSSKYLGRFFEKGDRRPEAFQISSLEFGREMCRKRK